ncbi:MAG: class I SAM-dependent methyltransferase [Methanoregula sp.]
MLKKVEECILCHSKDQGWEVVCKLNPEQNLVQCTKCGLFFNDFQRTDFDVIYSDEYFVNDEKVDFGGGFFNYSALEHGIQKMYRFAYMFIISRSDPKTKYKLMDIGCSYGFFLKMFLDKNNFSLTGVELNKQAANEARKHNFTIYMIPFEELEEPGKYDYISFFELLEHTLSPIEVMKKVKVLLKPGGYAIISTPDIGSIFFKILKIKWPSIHPAVHNYYFDESTIKLLAEASDFEIVSVHTTQIMWSDFFHFRKRLSEMFPVLKKVLVITSFMDSWVVPFLNGGDLRVILRKKV